MRPTGMQEVAKLDCGWTLYADLSDPKARPWFKDRHGRVRTPFEVAKLPEGRVLFREIARLWKKERRTLRGPWREDAIYRAVDYAQDAVRNMLQFERRWSPELMMVD